MSLLICLILIVLNKIENANSEGCFNENADEDLICSNILGKFPNGVELKGLLTCVNCNVPILNNETSPTFQGTTFNMSYSHIKTIKKDAFKKFSTSVEILLFNNNELTNIETDTYRNFSSLSLLNFRNNYIQNLRQNQFDGVRIGTLDLSRNQIVDITNVFNGLRVHQLNISHNKINEIKTGTFAELTMSGHYWNWGISDFYTSIILASNEISKIDAGAFEVIGELKFLFLQNNYISAVEKDMFRGVNLLKLDMSKNRIRFLEPTAFSSLIHLQDLSLQYNHIKDIPPGFFSTLSILEKLRLNNNLIHKLEPTAFSGLVKLRELDLSHNWIETISDSVLIPTVLLRSLVISYNRISSINFVEILNHNKRLRTIDVTRNFWQCNELIRMYKLQNQKTDFEFLSGHDFNVTNLHGIPCSRNRVNVTFDLTFDKFFEDIARAVDFEILYDAQLEPNVLQHEEKSPCFADGVLYYLLLVCAIIYIIYVLCTLFKFLRKRNFAKKNFFVLFKNESDVEIN